MSEQEATAANWLDSFVEYVKQALDIVQIKTDAIDKASRDEEAFTMGLVIIALGGVAAAIGTFNPFGIIALPIISVIGTFIFTGICHLLATMVFKGEGEFLEFFRPLSLACVLQWVNVVPLLNIILGWIVGLWLLVVAVVCVERAYKLERVKAIAVVAIPVLAMFILMVMFFAVIGMALWVGLR